MKKIKGKYGCAMIYATNIDEVTIQQVTDLMNQRFVEGLHVRIMADCHAGAGCVIGTTMKVIDCCVPNLVGVDIGCGMFTVFLGKINVDLEKLDEFIIDNIPCGEEVFEENQLTKTDIRSLYCYDNLKHKKRFNRSNGTLGGGNHFIEIDKDEEDNLYLIIHTGSRNLGLQVCQHYMKVAYENLKKRRDKVIKETVERLTKQNKQKLIQSEVDKIKRSYDLVNKDLLPLYDEDFKSYLHDMNICQQFAWENRETIASKIMQHLKLNFNDHKSFHTVHNYINMNDMILRKGAISAYKGEMVLIPINMKDGSIIAMGKSNGRYNFSAPHGAGRILSRHQAKKTLSLDDFKEAMKGIYSSSICKSTIDESPFVYKSIDDIIPNILPTVDIVKIIKPIYNFKTKN